MVVVSIKINQLMEAGNVPVERAYSYLMTQSLGSFEIGFIQRVNTGFAWVLFKARVSAEKIRTDPELLLLCRHSFIQFSI